MFQKKKSHTTVRLVRLFLLAILLVAVILLQAVPGWGDVYAQCIYPIVGKQLSGLSALVPFAVGDLFIALSLVGVVAWPFYVRFHQKRRWCAGLAGSAEYLVWVYVWFYLAWGLNYSQSDFYHRAGISPAQYTEEDFHAFARHYINRLNASYTPSTLVSPDTLCQEAVKGYKQIAPRWGVHAPFNSHPKVKTMLFSRLASMVGVKGSMGPFFCEFTVNGDLLPNQYPATYTHELAHLLGISSEAEANFYAYQVCSRSRWQAMRFSGYLSLLPHVLSNARPLLTQEEFEALAGRIRPEVVEVYEQNRLYWTEKYSPFIGSIQDWMYDLYLKGNKIESGRQNYSQVVGLLISYEMRQKDKH